MKTLKAVPTIENQLASYFRLQRDIKMLEVQRDEIKEGLKTFDPGVYGEFELTKIEFEQENFSWSKAREDLTPAELKKMTKWVNVSQQIRIKVVKI